MIWVFLHTSCSHVLMNKWRKSPEISDILCQCHSEVENLSVWGHVHIDTSKSPGSHVWVIHYSKHEFACIPIADVHNNTGSIRVRVTLKYEQGFVYSSSFPRGNSKNGHQKVDVNNYIVIMAHMM